ncbi:MAG: CDP-diacylglycerol--glycerol-3-phosphate 3-phosphatidyltransferase [Coxiella sp. RIFCSPHIGHO2_12_FULL_42_15]|nr:MAG: CDP-diacylglycerol--glycerol-3-phosphate 3-phosphatidyltransferase [Coxiella sp. RIFCSPHIGHO2_12_FULL_42_15]
MSNIPIQLTLLRILAIPVFLVAYYLPFYWAHPMAAMIFVLAAVTDWLDGYLARSLKQATKLGAFLDPVADKLLVGCAMVLVVGENYFPFLAIAAAIIVLREIAISALREWMAEIGKRTSVAVTFLAKAKTFLQMTALVLLIWYTPSFSHAWVIWTGSLLLFIAAALTLWTMVIYLKIAWPDLTLSGETQ